jgi:hypothetical protein
VKAVESVVVVETVVGDDCVIAALAIDGVMTNMVERTKKTAPSHEAVFTGNFDKRMCET